MLQTLASGSAAWVGLLEIGCGADSTVNNLLAGVGLDTLVSDCAVSEQVNCTMQTVVCRMKHGKRISSPLVTTELPTGYVVDRHDIVGGIL